MPLSASMTNGQPAILNEDQSKDYKRRYDRDDCFHVTCFFSYLFPAALRRPECDDIVREEHGARHFAAIAAGRLLAKSAWA